MNKGSTFIDVVVTLTVIGIVSFIVVTFLYGAKNNVKVNNVQSALSSVVSTALACIDSGKPLFDSVGGEHICEGSILLWPVMPDDWAYLETKSSVEDATISFGARSLIENKKIICNQKSCIYN